MHLILSFRKVCQCECLGLKTVPSEFLTLGPLEVDCHRLKSTPPPTHPLPVPPDPPPPPAGPPVPPRPPNPRRSPTVPLIPPQTLSSFSCQRAERLTVTFSVLNSAAVASPFSFYWRCECHETIVCGLAQRRCLQLTQIPPAAGACSLATEQDACPAAPFLESDRDQNSLSDTVHSYASGGRVGVGVGWGGVVCQL